jgi:hypothetical protein
VAEQKKEKFGYSEGFKKGGLAQYHLPSFGYPSRNYTPPDALFAPEHNFRHALEVNPNFPMEGVYGRDYGMGGICVRVTNRDGSHCKILPGTRSELEKQKGIKDFGRPTGFNIVPIVQDDEMFTIKTVMDGCTIDSMHYEVTHRQSKLHKRIENIGRAKFADERKRRFWFF